VRVLTGGPLDECQAVGLSCDPSGAHSGRNGSQLAVIVRLSQLLAHLGREGGLQGYCLHCTVPPFMPPV